MSSAVESKRIYLSQGKYAVIDTADFDWLSQWKWTAKKDGNTGRFYAYRKTSRTLGPQRDVYMHREICGVPTGIHVDHANHDGLDNRRSNLRAATHSQNQMNRKICSRNKTGFKGVHLNRKTGLFVASIRCNKKYEYLGQFDAPEKASIVRQAREADLFGNFSLEVR